MKTFQPIVAPAIRFYSAGWRRWWPQHPKGVPCPGRWKMMEEYGRWSFGVPIIENYHVMGLPWSCNFRNGSLNYHLMMEDDGRWSISKIISFEISSFRRAIDPNFLEWCSKVSFPTRRIPSMRSFARSRRRPAGRGGGGGCLIFQRPGWWKPLLMVVVINHY